MKPGCKNLNKAKLKARVVFDPDNQSHPSENSQSSMWEVCPEYIPTSETPEEDIIDNTEADNRHLQDENTPSYMEHQRVSDRPSRIPKQPTQPTLKDSRPEVQDSHKTIMRESNEPEKTARHNEVICDTS